ncbi:MAG: type II secretion system major pseudopilin GspG [Deltaproteobacteria bacterium]|nr:type II secretion system major pseudopilin GspG [Deltaproteobacteria bacterium]
MKKSFVSMFTQASRAAQRGMNLIEIMVVLVIISLVVGVVGVNVLGQLDKAKMSAAKTQIKQFEEALELYKLSKHRYPSSGEGLAALQGGSGPGDKPFLKEIPNDPWDKSYVYIQPGTHNPDSFDIISYGADGVEGGSDDIGNWKSAH